MVGQSHAAQQRARSRAGCFQTELARGNPEFQEPKLSRNLALVERFRVIGARRGKSSGEVAIAWALRNPAVTGATVGARNAKQVDGIIGGATFRLTPKEITEIEGAR